MDSQQHIPLYYRSPMRGTCHEADTRHANSIRAPIARTAHKTSITIARESGRINMHARQNCRQHHTERSLMRTTMRGMRGGTQSLLRTCGSKVKKTLQTGTRTVAPPSGRVGSGSGRAGAPGSIIIRTVVEAYRRMDGGDVTLVAAAP